MPAFSNLDLWPLQPDPSIRIISIDFSLLRIPIVLGAVPPEFR